MAEAGAKAIVFADIKEETAKEAAEKSKQYAAHAEYQAAVYQLDITDADSVQKMVDFVIEKFGRIDYAVNGAGVSPHIDSSLVTTGPHGILTYYYST